MADLICTYKLYAELVVLFIFFSPSQVLLLTSKQTFDFFFFFFAFGGGGVWFEASLQRLPPALDSKVKGQNSTSHWEYHTTSTDKLKYKLFDTGNSTPRV